MLYIYQATDTEGKKFNGSIEAPSIDLAINSLQKRNLIIISIVPEKQTGSIFSRINTIGFFQRIHPRDVVVLSRQLSTLFEAKVPVLGSFQLLAGETENLLLRQKLNDIIDDLRGGMAMSDAMAKHPQAFSKFFVNMIRSGEEAGTLEETFIYLADYLERTYELSSKAKRALIYPAFVISAFFAVMILMFVLVIPKLSSILDEVGQELPFFTKVIMGFSGFLVEYGIYILILIAVGIVFLWRYARTKNGKDAFARLEISAPYIGSLFRFFLKPGN